MVEADFVSAIDSSAEYVLPSAKAVTQTDGNRGFESFKCNDAADLAGFVMKCSKLQLWPAASYSGGYRFEKDGYVEAYYY